MHFLYELLFSTWTIIFSFYMNYVLFVFVQNNLLYIFVCAFILLQDCEFFVIKVLELDRKPINVLREQCLHFCMEKKN